MALTTAERERVRYHLGYLQVQPAAAMTFGLPRPIQTLFIVESAMERILEVAIPRVRRILDVLDKVECRLESAQARLAATQLGDLHLRDGEPDLLEREYDRWARRLADIFGVPLYPYAKRFQSSRAGNVSVVG